MPGVIFDFNGTMFFDDDKHVVSWKEFAELKFRVTLTDEDFDEHIHGHNNAEILSFLARRSFTKAEVFQLAKEKELLYQKLCERDTQHLHLSPGLEAFLTILKKHNVKLAIATASMKPNVDWYIKTFDLLRFFKKENIIYDDGTLDRGKPDPLIYQRAFKALNITPEEAIIFEDSLSGLQSAIRSKAKYVISISDRKNKNFDLPGIKYRLNDFNDIPQEICDFLKINK